MLTSVILQVNRIKKLGWREVNKIFSGTSVNKFVFLALSNVVIIPKYNFNKSGRAFLYSFM